MALTVNSNRQVVCKYSLFYLFSIDNFGILICFVYYHTRLFSGFAVKIILSQMWMLKVYLMFNQNTIVSSGMANIKIILYFFIKGKVHSANLCENKCVLL